eukprot:GSChrysophyteH2.ASY1.ANO1.1140.1 assembled CDS
MTTILSVAEKPSVARELANILCANGSPQKRSGKSKYNHIFDCGPAQFRGGQCQSHAMTSVSGHTMDTDFGEHKSWNRCAPIDLFTLPVYNKIKPEAENIAKTLESEAKRHNTLLLWLDCDLEGENIAFEVIQICKEANPRLNVFRARFSALIPRDIFRAMQHPEVPNAHMNDAVEARKEIDLRIGAAFTRFQTLRLQNKYKDISGIVSYGPCQFPTLGFVIERHLRVEAFRAENFWKLKLDYIAPDNTEPSGIMECAFSWDRGRLFDKLSALLLYETDERPTTRWRPVPLNTVELQKRSSRFLRISSEKTMQVAEELYNRGILSYPRTETDFFKEGFELNPIIQELRDHSQWGAFAANLLDQNKFEWPKNGGHDDQAHPPIHPLKNVDENSFRDQDEKKVYELVTRHFLACCAQDARGFQSTLTVRVPDLQGECFSATGLKITEKNWLDVYKFEHWSAKKVPNLKVGDTFEPSTFVMEEGHTVAPSPISESDLIGVMDKNGIGTDATIASHIKTIQDRDYAQRDGQGHFHPTKLGMALFEAYKDMGYNLTKPTLRAAMERDCQSIARGQMQKEIMVQNCLNHMKDTFRKVSEAAGILDRVIAKHFGRIDMKDKNDWKIYRANFSKCKCGQFMKLLIGVDNTTSKDKRVLYCEPCEGFYFVPAAKQAEIVSVICPICDFQVLHATPKAITGAGAGNRTPGPWHFCPYCYNNTPPPPAGPIDSTKFGNNFRCYNCCKDGCPLAAGQKPEYDVDIRACSDPQCKGKVRVKKIKSGKFMAACSLNDSRVETGCKQRVWWLPKCIKRAEPQAGKNCNSCFRRGFSVLKIKVGFDLSSAPPGMDPEVIVCPVCDPLWENYQWDPMRPPAPAVQMQVQLQPQVQPQLQRREPPAQVQTLLQPLPSVPQVQVQAQAQAQPQIQTIGGGSDYGAAVVGQRQEQPPPSNPPASGAGAFPPGAGADSTCPPCQCNPPQQSMQLTSNTPANPNRKFYKCPKQKDDISNCNFFQWADESGGGAAQQYQQQYQPPPQQQQQQQYQQPQQPQQQYQKQAPPAGVTPWNQPPPAPAPAGPIRNRAGGASATAAKPRKAPAAAAAAPAGTVCMHCKQEGHWARSCPEKK